MRIFTKPARPVGLLALCFFTLLGCKKDEAKNPLLACRPSSSGGGNGVGSGRSTGRTVMFWVAQDFGCGPQRIVSIRNTETQGTSYGGSNTITRYFSTQPACGATGTGTIDVAKGYEYEYTISCNGRQWKDKFTADCGDDCIVIQLK